MALSKTAQDLEIAKKTALDLFDESTEELEANIQENDEINRRVRANLDKDKAEMDAQEYVKQYDLLTASIEEVRHQKSELLSNADLPLWDYQLLKVIFFITVTLG